MSKMVNGAARVLPLYKVIKRIHETDHEETLLILGDMAQGVLNGFDPEDILHWEGLEPDYAIDLLQIAHQLYHEDQ
jgi:hypothetical protein